MDEVKRQFLWAWAVLLAGSVPIALANAGWIHLMKFQLAALWEWQITVRGPLTLAALSGVGFGILAVWFAERLTGVCDWILFLPVAGACVLAVALAFALNAWWIQAPGKAAIQIVPTSAVSMLSAAAVRIMMNKR